jgi:isopentenyl diphosphate isomerase/L-lactate dehydrogenase-like FMN-dependent dehydrogenase
MKLDIANMTMTEKADAAFKLAALKVLEVARQTGTPVILWEDGRIVKRSWEELIDEVTSLAETANGDETRTQ